MFDNPFEQKIVHDIESLIKDDIHALKKQVIMELKENDASIHLERGQIVVRESFDQIDEDGFNEFLSKWKSIGKSKDNDKFQVKVTSQRQCSQLSLTEQRRNQNKLGFYEIVFDIEHK